MSVDWISLAQDIAGHGAHANTVKNSLLHFRLFNDLDEKHLKKLKLSL
jgi:hypothetical protein